jgi:hypothetical protein
MYVKTKTGYFSVLKIYGIDIFHYKQADKTAAYVNFAQAETRIGLLHKYIFTSGTPVLHSQREHVEYKLNKTEHEYRRYILDRQLWRFEIIEAEQQDRLAYLVIFGETKDELYRSIDSFLREMKDTSIECVTGESLLLMLKNYLCFDNKTEINTNDSAVSVMGRQRNL